MAQLHLAIFFPLTHHLVVVTITGTALMPSYLRPCAIIGIILCTSLLAIISASLSAISNPNGHQAAVQHVNTTGKLADCAHRPSGLKSKSFLVPLFRNAFIGSVHIDSNSYFDLVARAGGCECSDINSKWLSYTPPSKELE